MKLRKMRGMKKDGIHTIMCPNGIVYYGDKKYERIGFTRTIRAMKEQNPMLNAAVKYVDTDGRWDVITQNLDLRPMRMRK